MKRLSNKECFDKLTTSECYINTVNSADKKKVTTARKGTNPNTPSSKIGQVAAELGLRAYDDEHLPLVDPSWGLYAKPTVMCHAHDGGVEYQEEQVKYFGSAMLDLNDPGGKAAWDPYRARAKTVGLRCVYWQHVHNMSQVENALMTFKGDGTGGLNLEDIVGEAAQQGLSPTAYLNEIASAIDDIMGPECIMAIPTLGDIQQIDWSPLSRHVFLLEFFPNDPYGGWVGKSLEYLVRYAADNARAHGVKKLNMVCGIYYTDTNPNSHLYTADEYLTALKNQNEIFGGIYLGDNNGPNYERWAT